MTFISPNIINVIKENVNKERAAEEDAARNAAGRIEGKRINASKAAAVKAAAAQAKADAANPTKTDNTTGSLAKVSSVDGSFYTGDQKSSLSTLMMNLMIQRVGSVDDVLSGMINEMNDNNVTTTNMNDFLNGLRELRPDSTDGKTGGGMLYKLETTVWEDSGEKVWPSVAWGLTIDEDTQLSQSEVDQMIEVMKTKISSVNSNQQMAQIKLEKYTNVRDESMQMVSTVLKSSNQLLQTIMGNMD